MNKPNIGSIYPASPWQAVCDRATAISAWGAAYEKAAYNFCAGVAVLELWKGKAFGDVIAFEFPGAAQGYWLYVDGRRYVKVGNSAWHEPMFVEGLPQGGTQLSYEEALRLDAERRGQA